MVRKLAIKNYKSIYDISVDLGRINVFIGENGCGRQFVENPSEKTVSQETKDIIDRLLLERISLAGIARVVGISERRLQDYVNEKYKNIPKKINVKKSRKDVSRLNVMSCGLLLIIKEIRFGFGLRN